MHRIQQLAAEVLGQVESGHTLTEALAQAQRQGAELTAQERAALQDICYGSLRQLARLRFWLRRLVPKALPEPQLERVLQVALYQLVYTRAADYAIVNEAVKLAERLARGKFKALVNGVLRNFLRQREEMLRLAHKDLEAATNHPRWWVKAIQQAYPQEWSSILQWNNSHPPMTLRVNARKSTVAAIWPSWKRWAWRQPHWMSRAASCWTSRSMCANCPALPMAWCRCRTGARSRQPVCSTCMPASACWMPVRGSRRQNLSYAGNG
jgi:hypothetical protein